MVAYVLVYTAVLSRLVISGSDLRGLTGINRLHDYPRPDNFNRAVSEDHRPIGKLVYRVEILKSES